MKVGEGRKRDRGEEEKEGRRSGVRGEEVRWGR